MIRVLLHALEFIDFQMDDTVETRNACNGVAFISMKNISSSTIHAFPFAAMHPQESVGA